MGSMFPWLWLLRKYGSTRVEKYKRSIRVSRVIDWRSIDKVLS